MNISYVEYYILLIFNKFSLKALWDLHYSLMTAGHKINSCTVLHKCLLCALQHHQDMFSSTKCKKLIKYIIPYTPN